MPDKISFTDFGGKKKVRRIKKKRRKKAGINKEKMLDDLLLSKKDSASSSTNSESSSDFQFPFLELASSQSSPSAMNEWTPLEVAIINSGNGIARSVTISFDNLETRGKTILDKLDPAEEITLNFEVRTSSKDRKISRMDLYYHTVEGDTFSVVRRDWFPNDYEQADIFFSEIPPGEEDKADLYSLSIIEGKQVVPEGVYAFVNMQTPEGLMIRKYFVRKNNKWVEEQIDKDEIFTDTNKTLCDIQLSCATEDHYYKTSNTRLSMD